MQSVAVPQTGSPGLIFRQQRGMAMTQIRLVALWAISIAVLLGAALNRPLEAQTAQLLAKLNAVDHNLRWAAYGPHGIIVVMPYGPCATLNQMAPTQIGLSTDRKRVA